MTAALEVGEWSAACPGRTLSPGKTRYPFYRRLGGPQGRSGQAENLVPTEIRSRIVQPVAQSLYRLSYPANFYVQYNKLSSSRPIFDIAWYEILKAIRKVRLSRYFFIARCITPWSRALLQKLTNSHIPKNALYCTVRNQALNIVVTRVLFSSF